MILDILILSVAIAIGIIISKICLYIFNRVCYFLLRISIIYGNDWVQNKLQKLLI